MTYASLTQVKASLRITDTVDDTTIQLALNSVDEMINSYCGRTFGTAGTATTRFYAAAKGDVIEVDDLITIGTVSWSTDGATWTDTTDYQAEPLNQYTDGMTWPITRLRAINNFQWRVRDGIQTVKVAGTFGFGSIPASITQAAVLQTARIFRRADSPLGVAGWDSAMGAVQVRPGLDVDVRQLVDPYRKLRAAL